MRQDDRVGEPLLELDRDRRRGSAASIKEALGLFAHQLPELVGVELGMAARGGEEPADGACNRADSGPAGRQLAAG